MTEPGSPFATPLGAGRDLGRVRSGLSSFDLHRLAVAAEAADEALLVVATMHHRLIGRARDADGGSRSEAPAGIAALPVQHGVRVGSFPLPDYRGAADDYRHSLPPDGPGAGALMLSR